MSRQRCRAHEETIDDVKRSLDKEHLCLMKAKGMIQQQLKVLQVISFHFHFITCFYMKIVCSAYIS